MFSVNFFAHYRIISLIINKLMIKLSLIMIIRNFEIKTSHISYMSFMNINFRNIKFLNLFQVKINRILCIFVCN